MKHQEEEKNSQRNNKQQSPQAALTLDQLRDVQDMLRRPLTGRTVMIPLGPKAFVPGQLRPHVSREQRKDSESTTAGFTSSSAAAATTATSTTTDDDEEIVSFKNHLDGTLQQMTRQQAMQHLQEEMNFLLGRGKAKTPSQHSILKNLKKNEESATNKHDVNNNSSHTASSSSSRNKEQEEENPSSLLPFMEIREEYDETGQRVWSEAIDVTKRLELLEQQVLAGASGAAGGDAATTSEFNGYDDFIHRDDTARDEESNKDFSVNEEVATSTISENKKHQVSDLEYNVLSSRLEELARLEEEAKISKKINQTSSKKLQSKGWSKGFLNKSSGGSSGSSSKKKVVVARLKTEPEVTAPAPEVETVIEDKKKVVGFHEETAIKEIPRVGERSVHDIHKIKQQQRHYQQPPVPSHPLEESVFSGVIRERRPTARRNRGTSLQTSNSSSATRTTTSAAATAQPKQVSRFVQQRRQLG